MIRTKYKEKEPVTEKQHTLQELEYKLSEKQKQFVHEYIANGWNATLAYLKVYQCAWTTAQVNGCLSSKRPLIRQYLDYKKEDYERICGINKAKQIAEYSKIAYSSIAHLHNTWTTLKDFSEIPAHHKEAIQSIDFKTETYLNTQKELVEVKYVKVKLYDKVQALEKIDQLMGYKSAEKVKVETDTLGILGTGDVKAIRKAFKLDK